MDIEDVVNYVNNSPVNTNENVLRSMLHQMEGGSGDLPTGEIGQILRQGDGEYEFTDQCFYIIVEEGDDIISVEDFNEGLSGLVVRNKDELLEYLDSNMIVPCKISFNGQCKLSCFISDRDYVYFLINTPHISGEFFIDVADDCRVHREYGETFIPKTVECKINIEWNSGEFDFDEERGLFYAIPDSVQSEFGGTYVQGFDPGLLFEEQFEVEVYLDSFKVERLSNTPDDMLVFFDKNRNLYFTLSLDTREGDEIPIIILLPKIIYEGANEKYICYNLDLDESNLYRLMIDRDYPVPINMFNTLYESGWTPKLYLPEQNDTSIGYAVQDSEECDLFAQGTDTVHNTYTTIELNEYSGDLPDPEWENYCVYEGTITTHEFSEGGGGELPNVGVSDSGKVLGVNVDGEWDVLEQRVSTKYKVTYADMQTTDPDTGISVAASKFFDPMITDIYFDQFIIGDNTSFAGYIDEIGNYLATLEYNSIIPPIIHAYNLTSGEMGSFIYTEGLSGPPEYIFQYINCFGDLHLTFTDGSGIIINNSAFFIREDSEGDIFIDIPFCTFVMQAESGISDIELRNTFNCDLRLNCKNYQQPA